MGNSRLLQSVAHIKKLPWNNLMSKLFTVILTKEIRIRNKKVKEKMEDFDFEIPVLTYEMWNKGLKNVLLIDFILRDERSFFMSNIKFLALYICNTIAAVVLQTTHPV